MHEIVDFKKTRAWSELKNGVSAEVLSHMPEDPSILGAKADVVPEWQLAYLFLMAKTEFGITPQGMQA